MIVSLLYRAARTVLSIQGVLLRRDTAKDAELLVLRHENTGPPRSTASGSRSAAAGGCTRWSAANSPCVQPCSRMPSIRARTSNRVTMCGRAVPRRVLCGLAVGSADSAHGQVPAGSPEAALRVAAPVSCDPFEVLPEVSGAVLEAPSEAPA